MLNINEVLEGSGNNKRTAPSKTYLYQINVTRDCNLRCTHCYIHSDVKAASKTMVDEQIEHIAKDIVEHMKSIKYQRAEIHFIGGEPTMLGLDFFKRNIPKFKETLKNNGFMAEVMIVTNLLHNDIVEICQQFDSVTTSYEVGSRFVSNKGTPKPALEKMWLANLKKVQAVGISVGVTTAVTKPVYDFGARNILDYFFENNIKQIHFGFFIPEGDGLVNYSNIMPAFHESSQFMIDAANWYLERREEHKDLWVNPFESMLSGIHTNTPLDDIVCPIISGSMDINWDGNAATCLEAGGAKNPDWAGNVFDTSIKEVAKTKVFMMKVLDARRPQNYCMTCDEYKVCKSACGVLFRYFDPSKDQDCPGFKKFIKFVRKQHEDGLIPRYTHYVGKSC